MPIYNGLSQVNPSQIVINGKQMQKVYCGDKLVWQKTNPIFQAHYGLLYNFYAATDPRNIVNAGWHIPTYSNYTTLESYLGGSNTAGNKMKEIGTVYWQYTQGTVTNSAKFNGRGAGLRDQGIFGGLKSSASFIINWNYNATQTVVFRLSTGNTQSVAVAFLKTNGASLRPIKDTTTLSNGQEGTYTGNDGKIYRTICIGTQEWLADNLAETRFRNGDLIPQVTDNTAWAALTTPAWCYYNNDPANM